jgi:hypothetical protein
MFPANFLATPPPPRLFNVIIKSVCCLTAKRQAIIHHDRRDSAATSKEIPAAATRAKDGRFVLICSPTPPDGPDATVFVWRRRRGFPIGAIFVISGPHTSTKLIAPPRAPRTKTAFETPPGDNYVRARGVHQFHAKHTKKIQFGKSTPGTGEINPWHHYHVRLRYDYIIVRHAALNRCQMKPSARSRGIKGPRAGIVRRRHDPKALLLQTTRHKN